MAITVSPSAWNVRCGECRQYLGTYDDQAHARAVASRHRATKDHKAAMLPATRQKLVDTIDRLTRRLESGFDDRLYQNAVDQATADLAKHDAKYGKPNA